MGSLDDDNGSEPYQDLDIMAPAVFVAITALGAVGLGLSGLYLLAKQLIGF